MVVITGCYAQLKPKEIASIAGVDLVLGAAEKFNISRHLAELSKGDSAKICSCDIETVDGFNTSFSMNDRTRSFLKVQDGCDYNCSFCTIPLARGKSRSDTIEHVVQQAKYLATQNVKEIVLTGINLGDFGKGVHGSKTHDESFLHLIQALDEVEGIERFRISSIEPNLLTNEIIALLRRVKSLCLISYSAAKRQQQYSCSHAPPLQKRIVCRTGKKQLNHLCRIALLEQM